MPVTSSNPVSGEPPPSRCCFLDLWITQRQRLLPSHVQVSCARRSPSRARSALCSQARPRASREYVLRTSCPFYGAFRTRPRQIITATNSLKVRRMPGLSRRFGIVPRWVPDLPRSTRGRNEQIRYHSPANRARRGSSPLLTGARTPPRPPRAATTRRRRAPRGPSSRGPPPGAPP